MRHHRLFLIACFTAFAGSICIDCFAESETAHVNTDQAAEAIKQLEELSPSAGSPDIISSRTPSIVDKEASPSTQKEEIALPLIEGESFAVFVRQKALWIIIDKTTHLSAEVLHTSGANFINKVQKIPNTHATVFVLSLNNLLSASVKKSSTGVSVVLQQELSQPLKNLVPQLYADDAQRQTLSIPIKAEKIISIHDPLMGDELSIIPLSTIGTGISSSHSFVEFNVLQSAQGIVIQKIADGIDVALHKEGLDVSSSKGLSISPELAQSVKDMETNAIVSAGNHSSLFPYALMKIDDEKNLIPAELKFIHEIAHGNTASANKARLKLLDIYLSEGLFPEAWGMADDILRTSYKFYRDNKVAALRGAAYFFMYRFNEANRDFSSPELTNVPEAAMWRSLCKEMLNEGTDTFNFLDNYDTIIRTYPPVFIQRLAIIAADHSINRKEYDTATSIFDLLKKDDIDEPVAKYINYMRAKIFSETHNEEEAAKIWEQQAANVDDSLIRARAEFSLVNMLLRQDKISHEEAIKRLEKLRIVWRGDRLEINTLSLLSSLYVQEKQYINALRALRDIVLYYPEAPEAVATAKQMEEIFVSLFNKSAADNNLSPLQALSLFYEFRDLVPPGKDGDMMVRNLADRLANIDLLDRAATLLDHQIRNRLQKDERSRVGARLALIYLLNHQPKEALETLKTTGYGDLPADLQLTRIRLTAQALAQQGQADKAIDVLISDNSNEGNLLRLSIYWDIKDWTNVIATAEEILGNRNDPSAPLTPQEANVLLELATAYVYEHDTGQIQYLRDYFTPLLQKSAAKDSFLFITSESGSIDYQTLANLDKDITEVKSFLDSYRDKVQKNGLSNTIN